MRLDPEVKKQVEAALKTPVPSPTDPEFDELLLRLRKENPELASLLESGVVFDDLPTPEEETARAVARRSSLLTLKHRLLDRYDELTGEWVPSRPKQIAVGFLGLVLATTLWFTLSTRETGPAKGGLPVPVATSASQQPVPVQPPAPTPAPSAPSESPSAQSKETATTPGGTPENPGTSDASSVPPPPSGYSEVPPPPPSGYPASSAPAGYANTGTAAQPAPPQPLTIYSASAAPAQSATGQAASTQPTAPSQPLTLYTTPSLMGAGLTLSSRPSTPPTSSSRPVTGSVADDVAASLQGQPAPSLPGGGERSVTAQAQSSLTLKKETQSTFAVRAVEGQGGQGGSFYLVGGSAPPSSSAPPQGSPFGANLGDSLTGKQLQASLSPAPAVPQAPAFPTAPVAGAQTPTPLRGETSVTVAAAPYPLGTRLKGRLGVGVLIAEGAPGAVAIDAEDGSTWVGEVTLDETRRLKGKLTRVIKDGREYATNATLLDAEGTLGVAARVREEAPSIAADLIRGSLRGVSDYVTAASQAKSVTVLPGGGVAQSSQTPPLELFMAGSLANLFALQQDKKAVVRVAQAEKGTEVVILVVPDPTPNPATGK